MSTKNLLFSGMILFVLLSSFVMTLSFAKTSWVVWNQTYGGPNDDQARSVVVTSDGGYAVGGYTTSFGAGLEDFF